ncbi:hypothetical protein [Aquipuribacter sp. SD81]|uniref:hypothetical protein n=1 Tax=Aquipuribacter sp. SD81 TaxID=3127703 RepID=UPI0030183ABF
MRAPDAGVRLDAAVLVALSGAVTWVLWVCLVVDPRETLGVAAEELGPVLPPGLALGLLATYVLPVAGLAVPALLLARLGWREWRERSRAAACLWRLVPTVGLVGLVLLVAPLYPGFPLGLAALNRAEALGVAPESGSMSGVLVATGAVGAVVVVVAGAAGLVLVGLVHRWMSRTARMA